MDDAFAQLQKDGAEAVVLQPSLPSRRIAELALRQRLPSFAPSAGFPAVGGLTLPANLLTRADDVIE